jgi:hypothetical protein
METVREKNKWSFLVGKKTHDDNRDKDGFGVPIFEKQLRMFPALLESRNPQMPTTRIQQS